ncbi:unnamed protein product, partial [Onchocerca ochengi]
KVNGLPKYPHYLTSSIDLNSLENIDHKLPDHSISSMHTEFLILSLKKINHSKQ